MAHEINQRHAVASDRLLNIDADIKESITQFRIGFEYLEKAVNATLKIGALAIGVSRPGKYQMSKDRFNAQLIDKIISLHDCHFSILPSDSRELYETEDAIMWDGYIQPVLELNETIDSTFRLNSNIKQVDISAAYEPGGIEGLSVEEIGFVFRDILVNEKIHLGLFASVIVDGRVSRLVNRLKELRSGNVNKVSLSQKFSAALQFFRGVRR